MTTRRCLAAFVKAAIGDFGDAAGNVAAVASTCARRRLVGTAEEENLEFNADPCSSRRLRAVGLVLAAMSETVGCRRVRDACCSFVRDILQATPSASLGFALRTIDSWTVWHFATDGKVGDSLCCVGTSDRGRVGDACCSLVWDSLQSTTCAGWELAVCSAVDDVGGPRGSCVQRCRDVGRRRVGDASGRLVRDSLRLSTS